MFLRPRPATTTPIVGAVTTPIPPFGDGAPAADPSVAGRCIGEVVSSARAPSRNAGAHDLFIELAPTMNKPLVKARHHFVEPLPADAEDGRLLVTLTVSELRELVREAVVDLLAEHHHESAVEPLTLSGAEMARKLGVSRSTMAELRTRDGCPAVRIGDHFRFEPAAVMAWLRSQSSV